MIKINWQILVCSCRWDLAEWLERLTAYAEVATVLVSIPASSDTVESEGWQMKQCWIQYIEKKGIFYYPIIKNNDLSFEKIIILYCK